MQSLIVVSLSLMLVGGTGEQVKVRVPTGENWSMANDTKPPSCGEFYKLGVLQGYVAGFAKGANSFSKDATDDKTMKELKKVFPIDTDYHVIVKGLDQFYSDYRNTDLPIYVALEVDSNEQRGESKEKIDSYLRRCRSILAKDSDKEGQVKVTVTPSK